jgi:hypothetical protein
MPSPFPGMDPYLEGSFWQSVHTQLISEIARQLAPRLRPRYLAFTTERLVLTETEGILHVNVEIRDTANRKLITVIEVLTPTNKGGDWRGAYVRRREALLQSPVNLLEIDLLRKGYRIPLQMLLPPGEYYVFLNRSKTRNRMEVWPIELPSPLPTVSVPLLPGDADVPLDLQLALTTIYDLLNYDLAIDYTHPPEVPLSPAQQSWAEALLKPQI